MMQFHRHHLLQRLEGVRQASAARGHALPIAFDFIDDPRFNAFAARHHGVDLIAINAGLPLRIEPLMYALVSQPGSFPETGNPSARVPVSGLDAQRFIHGGLDVLPDTALPLDLPEAVLTTTLSSLAIDFVFSHELSHILHGHVDWVSQNSGLSMIDEVHGAGYYGITSIDLQTLEFDADCGAVQNLVQFAFQATARLEGGRNLLAIPTFGPLGSYTEATRKICFALYACAKMFESTSEVTTIDEAMLLTHPPARFRMHGAVHQLIHVLHVVGGVPLEYIMPMAALGVIEAEDAWSRAFGVPLQLQNPDLSGQLLEAYAANWASVRPQLIAHKRPGFGDLAAVVSGDHWMFMGQ